MDSFCIIMNTTIVMWPVQRVGRVGGVTCDQSLSWGEQSDPCAPFDTVDHHCIMCCVLEFLLMLLM